MTAQPYHLCHIKHRFAELPGAQRGVDLWPTLAMPLKMCSAVWIPSLVKGSWAVQLPQTAGGQVAGLNGCVTRSQSPCEWTGLVWS